MRLIPVYTREIVSKKLLQFTTIYIITEDSNVLSLLNAFYDIAGANIMITAKYISSKDIILCYLYE